MVTGAHPVIPLDLAEATWLVELPDGPLTMEELIGYRAKALAKHYQHVEEMRERVGKDKLKWALRFAEEHKNSIKDYNFKPLDLVLVKNMITKSSFSAKMMPRFHGPLVVITKTKGGNYIVAELDGSVWQARVAAFRVVPYKARKKLTLPQGLEKWVDITPAKLKELKEELRKPMEERLKDLLFELVRLHKSTELECESPVDTSEMC
ncbi:hypothetical protein C0992_011247 [Termitomyces sp. T32_za158]|nr:hypothetical protein C0992_012518 [Termitomyces sp. T32_za158]KAG6893108.1 hypothetical protein C0992_011247 [Termitomyces sp. T32_za158]